MSSGYHIYPDKARLAISGSCNGFILTQNGWLGDEREYRFEIGAVSDEDGKKDIFKYIEVFYNRKRRHASLGYVSPVVCEEMHEMKQDRAA